MTCSPDRAAWRNCPVRHLQCFIGPSSFPVSIYGRPDLARRMACKRTWRTRVWLNHSSASLFRPSYPFGQCVLEQCTTALSIHTVGYISKKGHIPNLENQEWASHTIMIHQNLPKGATRGTPMRGTSMRCTPMRCTPMRGTSMEYTPIRGTPMECTLMRGTS